MDAHRLRRETEALQATMAARAAAGPAAAEAQDGISLSVDEEDVDAVVLDNFGYIRQFSGEPYDYSKAMGEILVEAVEVRPETPYPTHESEAMDEIFRTFLPYNLLLYPSLTASD